MRLQNFNEMQIVAVVSTISRLITTKECINICITKFWNFLVWYLKLCNQWTFIIEVILRTHSPFVSLYIEIILPLSYLSYSSQSQVDIFATFTEIQHTDLTTAIYVIIHVRNALMRKVMTHLQLNFDRYHLSEIKRNKIRWYS